MTLNELTWRVTVQSATTLAVLALLVGAVAGVSVGAGVAAAGALSILNFRWLVRGASALAPSGRAPRAAAMLATGARFLVAFGALALVLGSGWVQPLGVMAGLAVLPVCLVAQGLRASREMDAPRGLGARNR
jgi:hypothetical protein